MFSNWSLATHNQSVESAGVAFVKGANVRINNLKKIEDICFFR